jgi:tetratricopeptide (TPR) repeat protein
MSQEIAIDVRTLFALADQTVPETLPPSAVLESMIREQFSFLSNPVEIVIDGWRAVVTYPDAPPTTEAEAGRLADRAARRAAEGDYTKAIGLWRRALKMQPANFLMRRDLAMALVEQGETEEAKSQLVDALRVQPNDVWSLVVLANLYIKHEKNLQTAEHLLDHAEAVDADDPWVLNSRAALRVQQARVSEALGLFERGIAAAPSFANPYLGMAMALEGEGRTEEAKTVLDRLFLNAETQDARSVPVFVEARTLYRALMAALAASRRDAAILAVESMKHELGSLSGHEILVRPGQVPGGTVASLQAGWKHQRDHHLVVYREDYPEDPLLHLVAHELGHLRLELAARAEGRNRLFVSTSATREKAIRSMEKDVARWQRQGYDEKGIMDLTLQLVDGMARQLFNAPIDLLIEDRLHADQPELEAPQFMSLSLLMKEAEGSLQPRITSSLPRQFVRASVAMNGATALFLDALFGGATAYADPYRSHESFSVSKRLHAMFIERQPTLGPGDEYEIVDEWGKVLGLSDWYEWRSDEDRAGTPEPDETADDELLRERHPAAVAYFLDALRRFERMTDEEVRTMSMEIAAVGMGGLDYASPDQKYTLQSLPGGSFSGLQLMCLMYAGFHSFAPEVDVGMDLREPFSMAVRLHQHKADKS